MAQKWRRWALGNGGRKSAHRRPRPFKQIEDAPSPPGPHQAKAAPCTPPARPRACVTMLAPLHDIWARGAPPWLRLGRVRHGSRTLCRQFRRRCLWPRLSPRLASPRSPESAKTRPGSLAAPRATRPRDAKGPKRDKRRELNAGHSDGFAENVGASSAEVRVAPADKRRTVRLARAAPRTQWSPTSDRARPHHPHRPTPPLARTRTGARACYMNSRMTMPRMGTLIARRRESSADVNGTPSTYQPTLR